MSWPVSARWMAALGGSHEQVWECSAVRDGEQLAVIPLDGPPSMTSTWDGDKITTAVTISVTDGDGSLLTTDPLSPLAANGQAISLRAGMRVGSAWSEMIPMGMYRIEDSNPSGASWRMTRKGRWLSEGQHLSPSCTDYLAHFAEWDLLGATSARTTNAVTEMRRLIGGDLPFNPNGRSGSVSVGTTYESGRLGALVSLAGRTGSSLWVDRTTTVTLLPNAGVGPAWVIRPDDGAGTDQPTLISFVPESTRDGIINSVWTTGEDAKGRPISGTDVVKTGPTVWSRPLEGWGRAPYRRHNPLITTTGAARQDAATTLARLSRWATAAIEVECVCNLAIDCLDQVQIVTPTGTYTGVVSKVSYGATQQLTVLVPWEQVWRG